MNRIQDRSPQQTQPFDNKKNNLRLGRFGEEVAYRYFTQAGFIVLARNSRISHLGELDLVVCDKHVLIAVEVKTRRGTHYGDPLESITRSKLNRLSRLLNSWATAHPDIRHNRILRIDGFGVIVRPGSTPKFQHLAGLEIS